MKKLFLLTCLSLTACGPQPHSPFNSAAYGTSGSTATDCPVINATYQRTVKTTTGEEIHAVSLGTQREGLFFSYRLGNEGEFYRANSAAKRIDSESGHGNIFVSCTTSSIEFKLQEDNKEPSYYLINVLDENTIRVKLTAVGEVPTDEVYIKVK